MKIEEILLKLSDICRRKHPGYATEKSYKGWVQSYSREVLAMPGGLTSEEKVGAYLTQRLGVGLPRRETDPASEDRRERALADA